MTVYPADVVLFEGILAFYSQEVRDLFQMKLFVDTDADTRLSRRGTVGPTLPSGFTPSSVMPSYPPVIVPCPWCLGLPFQQ